MKRMTALAAAGLISLSACGFQLDRTERHEARTFPLGGTSLTITSRVGDLRVVPGDASGVKVERWLQGTAGEPGKSQWTLENGRLALSTDCTVFFGSCGARYTVHLPPGVALVVEGGDERVSLSRLPQDVSVSTTGGDITAEGLSGTLRLRTHEGTIRSRATRSADVRARSRDGDISVGFAAPPGKVDTQSRAGGVVVSVPEGEYGITVVSRNGRSRTEIKDAGDGSARTIVARSEDGDVRVTRT
ncbi:DUF4097 family beta strand repeat-containing protein [Nonomuraea africana]|uniref:DUF4097 domain-containing protein n=1 Tax=Nonomuraea africana TaxID=46171 RepID=A0ABR9KUJ1_9ACTN|nr:DUF4097 family beta strand repeat-containing protein [Nonomuraea africana]MBE1565700.1 hypothetical protein [Nonomuraea africana]